MGRPRTPLALREHECVQFSLSSHAREWTFTRGAEAVTVPVETRYKVTSSLAVRQALLHGFGLSLIPLIYVRDDLAAGRLCTALDDWTPVQTHIYAVYPSRRHLNPKVRAFVDFLLETLRDEGTEPVRTAPPQSKAARGQPVA